MDDCEVPIFSRNSEPVARKEHKCCECKAPILAGEKHFHCQGKWPGDKKPASYRQHLVCMEACMLIRDTFYSGECIGFGCLKEEFNEMRVDNWYPERDRFTPAWKKLRSLMAKILVRERAARRIKLREPPH